MSEKERYKIEALKRAKMPVSEISRQMGRDRRTIQRELARGDGGAINVGARACATILCGLWRANTAGAGAKQRAGIEDWTRPRVGKIFGREDRDGEMVSGCGGWGDHGPRLTVYSEHLHKNGV